MKTIRIVFISFMVVRKNIYFIIMLSKVTKNFSKTKSTLPKSIPNSIQKLKQTKKTPPPLHKKVQCVDKTKTQTFNYE